MCIVICKPRGVDLPPQSEIIASFNANRDGFGLAFCGKKDEKVTIRKGAMTLERVYNMLNDLKRSKYLDVMLHFRIATEGAVCSGNCHPFPLSGKWERLQALHTHTRVAVAHNGIITGITNTERMTITSTISQGAALCYEPETHVKGYREKDGTFHPYEWTSEEIASWYNITGGFYSTVSKYGLALKYSDSQVFVHDYLYPFKEYVLTPHFIDLIDAFVPGKFAFLSTAGFVRIGNFNENGGRFYSNESYKSYAREPTKTPAKVVTHAIRNVNEGKSKAGERRGMNLGSMGWWIQCDICDAFVAKNTTHQTEDSVVCSACYKLLEEDNKKNTDASVLPSCGAMVY